MTKKHWPILFLFFFVFPSISGQQLTSKSKKAIKYYQKGYELINSRSQDYEGGIAMMQKAINADKQFIEAYLIIADVYVEMKNKPKAIESYRKAVEINPDFFPMVLFTLGQLEYDAGEYEEAKGHLETFINKGRASKEYIGKSKQIIANCEFAIRAIANPVPFNPINLGDSVNSQFDEYWPSLSADESTLVFTVLLPKDPNNPSFYLNRQEDFYICQRKEDTLWANRKPVSDFVNTPDNEGAQTLSADGRIMVLTACNREDGVGGCDLYISWYKKGEWTSPVDLGPPVNSKYKDTQPSLSPDGKTLYFASNRPGGKGNMDIWKTTLGDDGFWMEPVNLGDSINTAGEEQSPFIHPDNRTLYFSSDTWPGMGKPDLFVSRMDASGDWGLPENLGYPINTNGQEIGLFVNAKGNIAYYSSDRMEGRGKDIFMFELPQNSRPTMVSYMKGKVFDSETNKPLAARFEIIDLANAVTTNQAASEGETGEFLVCIPTDKDYGLNVNRKGYLFYSDNFSLHGLHDITKPYYKDIPLLPIKEGQKIVLRNIFYATDSFRLKSESRAELNKVVEFLKGNPSVVIEISGHTDNMGTSQHNITLSQNRAKSVVDYLYGQGVDMKQMKYKGYGETQPITNNDTEEGRAQNRRTELKILIK
ncbi:MAG: PD40 domain-containing protein [Bacteroidales bacterium]|nr:PD40 domain-containing protein [Bacteroidales bacterium]